MTCETFIIFLDGPLETMNTPPVLLMDEWPDTWIIEPLYLPTFRRRNGTTWDSTGTACRIFPQAVRRLENNV